LSRIHNLYDRIYSPDYLWTNIPVNVRLPNEDALHSSKLREELSGPLIVYNIRDQEKKELVPT